MESLAWSLSKEVTRHGIHMNVVAPGLVETEMGRRLAKAIFGVDEPAEARREQPVRPGLPARGHRERGALPGVGRRAGYVTGEKLCVDGGPA